MSLAYFKFRFVERIVPDLKVMQAFDKSFAMGAGDIEMGYIGSEPVTVLVARGDLAEALKEIGIRIHQKIREDKDNAQDPNLN